MGGFHAALAVTLLPVMLLAVTLLAVTHSLLRSCIRRPPLHGHAFSGHAMRGHPLSGHKFGGHRLATHTPATHALAGRGLGGRQVRGANAFNGRTRLAAAHFHGLANFNHAGFNRNAFGAGRAWDRWGGRFWGAGWNQWGWGFGGWAGPVFWPFLYGDIFSYALWPYDYYDPFWAFGPDFLLASVYAPGPSFAPAGGDGSSTNVYSGGGSQETNAERSEAAQTCGDLAPGVSGLPLTRIRQAIRPNADQSAALDELNTASIKANDVIKQSCPTAIPLTPIARLDTAEKRLQSMVEAVQIVRPPLEKFYTSLDRGAEATLRSTGKIGKGRRTAWRHHERQSGGALRQRAGFRQAAERNVSRMSFKPNAQQQSSFRRFDESLAGRRREAAGLMPDTNAGNARRPTRSVKTEAGSHDCSMDNIRPKLAAFYETLNDEQKAKFNNMGPPPNTSATRRIKRATDNRPRAPSHNARDLFRFPASPTFRRRFRAARAQPRRDRASRTMQK